MNQKISDLIANAEMEQSDYRRGGKPNVFFGAQKRYFDRSISVFTYNTAVLLVDFLACSRFCIGSCGGSWKCDGLNFMIKNSGQKNRLMVATSEQDADMLFATKFFAPDPFIFLEQNGKRTLV